MFIPHAGTVCQLLDLEHQERMRHAANQRIAASGQVGATPPPTVPKSAGRPAVPWLTGLLSRGLGAKHGRLASPLASS